jgi:hypothetical protein
VGSAARSSVRSRSVRPRRRPGPRTGVTDKTPSAPAVSYARESSPRFPRLCSRPQGHETRRNLAGPRPNAPAVRLPGHVRTPRRMPARSWRSRSTCPTGHAGPSLANGRNQLRPPSPAGEPATRSVAGFSKRLCDERLDVDDTVERCCPVTTPCADSVLGRGNDREIEAAGTARARQSPVRTAGGSREERNTKGVVG